MTLFDVTVIQQIQNLSSPSGKTSCRQIYLKSKSWSREIGCYNDRIVPKFDRHLGNGAAEVPVKFQSDCKSLNPILAVPRLCQILQ